MTECDVCGEETDLRQPVNWNGDDLLVCDECAEELVAYLDDEALP